MANKKVLVNTALDKWKTHNPFIRATPKLIRQVNKELLEIKRSKLKPALL